MSNNFYEYKIPIEVKWVFKDDRIVEWKITNRSVQYSIFDIELYWYYAPSFFNLFYIKWIPNFIQKIIDRRKKKILSPSKQAVIAPEETLTIDSFEQVPLGGAGKDMIGLTYKINPLIQVRYEFEANNPIGLNGYESKSFSLTFFSKLILLILATATVIGATASIIKNILEIYSSISIPLGI